MVLETRAIYGVSRMDDLVQNKSTKGRIKLDNEDEDFLYNTLVSFGMFKKKGVQAQNLHNIATKDVRTKEIESDL